GAVPLRCRRDPPPTCSANAGLPAPPVDTVPCSASFLSCVRQIKKTHAQPRYGLRVSLNISSQPDRSANRVLTEPAPLTRGVYSLTCCKQYTPSVKQCQWTKCK